MRMRMKGGWGGIRIVGKLAVTLLAEDKDM